MTALYEISNELLEASEAIEAMDISEQEKADSLAALVSEWGDKAEAVIAYIKNLDAEAKAYKAEADRLSKLSKAAGNKAESLKRYLVIEMQKTGKKDIGSGVHTAKLRKPAKVCIIDSPEEVPRELCKHTPESWTPSKTEIAKAIKAGEEVAGAHLEDGETKLAIK